MCIENTRSEGQRVVECMENVNANQALGMDGQLQASMLCINPSTREMGHASAENTKEGVWRRFRKRMLLRKG